MAMQAVHTVRSVRRRGSKRRGSKRVTHFHFHTLNVGLTHFQQLRQTQSANWHIRFSTQILTCVLLNTLYKPRTLLF